MAKVLISFTKDLIIDLEKVEFLTIPNLTPFDKNGLTDNEIFEKIDNGEIIVKSIRQVEENADSSDILNISVYEQKEDF